MKKERLEQKLREHFQAEVRGMTPPREWWDRKISRPDEEKKPSRWHWLIPRTRLAWALLPVILLFVGGTVYAAGSLIHNSFYGSSANHTQPGVYYVPTGVIYFQEIPDITVKYGESVGMNITFTNFDSTTRIMLNYPSGITIESRNLPFDDRIVRSFEPGAEQIHLEPGESKEYRLVWDQKDDAGQQVPYGWYEIRSMVQSQSVADTKHTRGSGGRITQTLILPPEGTMIKEFEISQSLTDNGVTIEVNKIELKANGTDLYTFIVPPDYAGGTEYQSFSFDAEYRVDDGAWKPARPAAFGTGLYEDGMKRIWDLDPVPLDSQELTFRINRIDNVAGPWEFKIPLR